MKICMLSYHTSPLAVLGGKHSGGMNVYVRELSTHLAALGHEVDVFTRGSRFEEQRFAPRARLLSLPAGPASEVEKNRLADYIPEFAENLLAFAGEQDRRYDVIHAHYWMSGLVGAQLKAAWGVPMALMFHTLGLVKNRITALGERESDARIRGERRALAAADQVVAATPAEQAELQWLYEVRSAQIGVIPPGVDLQHFQPMDKAAARRRLSAAQDEALLLFVGRIEALKGIDTLIRAAHLLAAEGPACTYFRVWIVGGDVEEDLELMGSEMSRLRSLARELGVQDQIEFLGSRSQEDLPSYYAAADVVVMPSYSESFGMVALEAMACGRPVVASRVGGLAYLVHDGITGFHVREGHSMELASRLAELLNEPPLLARLGQAARREAEDYSWQAMAQRIEELYRRMRAEQSA
ncbi:MAG: glycosyltransferase [Anaerolineales bacterium]|nr:glycosyltransferase [Anaerolineales bacterium]MCW5854921.1 glycosyltransferase [Anaerolineales bacterium]